MRIYSVPAKMQKLMHLSVQKALESFQKVY